MNNELKTCQNFIAANHIIYIWENAYKQTNKQTNQSRMIENLKQQQQHKIQRKRKSLHTQSEQGGGGRRRGKKKPLKMLAYYAQTPICIG